MLQICHHGDEIARVGKSFQVIRTDEVVPQPRVILRRIVQVAGIRIYRDRDLHSVRVQRGSGFAIEPRQRIAIAHVYLLKIELPAPEAVLFTERNHRRDHRCTRSGAVHELVKELEIPSRIHNQRHHRNPVLFRYCENRCRHLSCELSFHIDAITLRTDDGDTSGILLEARDRIG